MLPVYVFITWTAKITPFNLLYLFVLFTICHSLDISLGLYCWVIYFVKMWMCMNFKYLNLSHNISGVFGHILHVQCHIISHCLDIIVLQSAYVSWWMFWLLDKGPSRSNTCLQCKEVYKTFWGHVTAYSYENCVVQFMLFCVAVIEFVFGVLERRVTESEPTVGGMRYSNVVMWGFVCVCHSPLENTKHKFYNSYTKPHELYNTIFI
jgi:hypothetical protein